MVGTHIIRKRLKQLHPDQDIPSYPVDMLSNRVIFIRDNVRIANKMLHQTNLCTDFLYMAGKICFRVLIGHAIHA